MLRQFYILVLAVGVITVYGCHKNTPVTPKATPPLGTNGTVYAFTTYNNNLVVGGSFTTAGAISANNIALWDGVNWKAIGGGIPLGGVSSLVTYNNQLVAVTAGNIMLWDGNSWNSIGKSYGVFALTVYNGNLIAGGVFDSIAGIATNNIAQWNGNKWLPVGSGVNNSVFALATYKGNVIAGNYYGVDVWNGNTWSYMDSIKQGVIHSLIAQNDTLIASGTFAAIGNVPAGGVALLDGSDWASLGTNDLIFCYAVSILKGNIIATEQYGEIYSWNGTEWNTIGRTQYTDAPEATGAPGFNYASIVWNGNLYISGHFVACNGVSANGIVKWDGSKWTGF